MATVVLKRGDVMTASVFIQLQCSVRPLGANIPKLEWYRENGPNARITRKFVRCFIFKKKTKNNKKNLPCSVPVSMVRRSSLYFENINENLMVGKIFSVLVVLCFVDLERTIRAVLS